MAKHELTPRGDIVVTTEGPLMLNRVVPHFRWLKVNGKWTFQQLHVMRQIGSELWRGEWVTLWNDGSSM